MSVFDLDPQGAQQQLQSAREEGVRADQVEPGFFENAPEAIGMGIMRGGAKAARAVALAGAGLSILQTGDTEISDKIFGFIDDTINPAVDYWTPNPNELGTAGRVVGNLAEIVLPLAAGGGNPSLLMGSTGLNTALDLNREGVDAATATGVGLIDAAAVGVGFRLPFLGSTFLKKAASGAAGNLALGVGATAVDRDVLELGGYEKLAERYNPLDIEARTVDLLTGIAFGGLAHLQAGGRVPLRSERDAALTGLNAHHFEIETAPGRPADESASAAHQAALEKAIRDLQAGRPVDVADSRVIDGQFKDPSRVPPALRDPELRALLDELGIVETRSDPVARAEEAPDTGPVSAAEQGVSRDIEPPEPSDSGNAPIAARDASDASKGGKTTAGDEPVDVDVADAERIIESRDIQVDTGEVDAEGNARTVPAKDLLASAREEVAQARNEAKGYEAAVACFLSVGA